MDFEHDDLFAGIAGASLPVERVELGQGLALSETYAHLMAPLLMAFKPAPPGQPHPAPWHTTRGGSFGFDIQIQLHIPRSFVPSASFNRLNTIWWITSLLRLRTAPHLRVPVITDRPFEEGKDVKAEIECYTVEVEPRQLILDTEAAVAITQESLDWVIRHWRCGAHVMRQSTEFNLLVQTVDGARFQRSQELALLALWAALEGMFSPARTELRFRVSANIAAYLEDAGTHRRTLQKHVAKLYDARSKAAHGVGTLPNDALRNTYRLARRIILKVIEEGKAPTNQDLEDRLFGIT